MDGDLLKEMNMFRTGIALLVMSCIIGSASLAYSQGITPVYPVPNSSIVASEFRTKPIEWTAASQITSFNLSLRSLSTTLSFNQDGIAATTFFLNDTQISALTPGNYSISITTQINGQPFTESWVFEVVNPGLNLIPSPTPIGFQTPTPSGNIDGSDRINAKDVMAFASKWKNQNDPSGYQYDLDSNGEINQVDLLLLLQRQGIEQPTATPTPPAGSIRNLSIFPGKQVGVSQTKTMEISWDPPLYPDSSEIVYDILVESVSTQNDINETGLTTTTFRPYERFPNGFPFPNETVNIYVRARTSTGLGPIAVDSFQIVLSAQPLPTPTQTPFPIVDENIDPPSWVSVDVAVMEPSGLQGCIQLERTLVTLNQDAPRIEFDADDDPCATAALLDQTNGAVFEHEAIETASSYEYRTTVQLPDLDPIETDIFIQPVSDAELNKVTIQPGTFNDATFFIEVRAVLADGLKTEWGTPLELFVDSF